MVVHVDDVSLANAAVVAPVRLQWLQNTLKALVLILCKIWLSAVQKSDESFISFVDQTFKVVTHVLLIIFIKVYFVLPSRSGYSLWVSWLGNPSF